MSRGGFVAVVFAAALAARRAVAIAALATTALATVSPAIAAPATGAPETVPETASTATAGPTSADYAREAAALESYLWRHVLAPRFPRCVDRERGGFHATYARDWSPRPDEQRFIVYQARVVWTAAEIARAYPARRDEYLAYVRHGLRYLADVMWDAQHGGFHTYVSVDGKPVEPATKWTYGNAFGVYALAAVYRATGDPEALALARNGFEWIEKHMRAGNRSGSGTASPDPGGPANLEAPKGAYLGGVKCYGSRLAFDPDSVRPEKDAMYAPSAWLSMNVHIHVLEAYAELLKAAPDERVRERTREVLALLRDRFVVDPGVLHLFLTEDGRPIPGHVSYGHDFETGYLLLEAEEAIGDHDPRTAKAARRLVDHALAWGFDPATGQVFDKGFPLEPAFDRSVQWWEQFETLSVLALMHERHGRETPAYWEGFLAAWRFTRERFTDEEAGGIFLSLDEHGKVNMEKSNDWFASYHATRSLMLTAARFRRLAPPSGPSRP